MATQQEIIAQQRQALEQAKRQAEEQKRYTLELSQKQLRAQTIQTRAKQQAQQKLQRQVGVKQLRTVRGSEQKFETQVAQVAPEQAKKQYFEKAHKKAKGIVAGRLTGIKERLTSLKSSYRKAVAGDDEEREDRYRNQIQALEAEERIYSGALKKGGESGLIKGHFSGNLKRRADYASDVVESKAERRKAKKVFAQKKGFKSYSELVESQKMPAVTAPVKDPNVYKELVKEYKAKGQSASQAVVSAAFEMIERGKEMKVQQRQDLLKFDPTLPPELQKPFQREIKKAEIQKIDVKSYRDLGFTERQARTLAEKGWKQKMTFSPEGARQVLREQRFERERYRDIKEFERKPEIYDPRTGMYVAPAYGLGAGGTAIMAPPTREEQIRIQEAHEKGTYEAVIADPFRRGVKPLVREFGRQFGEMEVWEKEIKIPTLLKGGIGTGITIGEAVALPAKGVGWVAETAAEGWEYAYEEATKKLKNTPGRWVGGKFETRPKFGTEAWAEAIRKGKVIPLTAEKVGRGVETTIKGLTYAVPGVGPTYMVSEVAKGTEEYKGAEKKAKGILEKDWTQYQKDVTEARKELKEDQELTGVLTKKEYFTKYEPSLIKDIQQQAATGIGMNVLFLGTMGAGKVYSWGKTKVVTKVPTRPIKEEVTKFIEVKQIIKEGKKKDFFKYEIRGEKRPPILITETTKARKFFGMKPLKAKELPAIKYKQLSWDPLGTFRPKKLKLGERWVPSEGPSLSITFETGKKYGVVHRVRGEVVPRTSSDFAKLSKREKWEWQKLAEKITGRPVSEEMAFKILKKESLKFKGDSIAERLYRMKKTKEGISITTPWKPGTAITRAESVAEIIPSGQIGKVKLFKMREITKDITRPFAKRAGKVGVSKGLIVEHEPFVLDTAGKGIGGITPGVTKTTPFADTFGVQKLTTKMDIKLPPKPKPSKLPPPKTVLDIKSSEMYPSMVGGAGMVISTYDAKGMYERTEIAPVFKDSIISKVKVLVSPVSKPRISPLQISMPKTRQLEEQLPMIAPVISPAQIPALSPVQIPTQRPILRPIQKPIQRPKQRPLVRQMVRPQIRVKPRPRPIAAPIVKLPIHKGPPKRKRVPLTKPVPQQGYSFEVKRKGKWVRAKMPFAFATTQGAEAKAQKIVLKEAAASYRVVKAKKGKKVVRSREKLSAYRDVLFRKGKEKGVMVQKKLLRILTPGEKKEISYAGATARMKKTKAVFKMTKEPKKKVSLISKKRTKKGKKK